MPLQHRHDYAAGLRRGLPVGDTTKEFPAHTHAGARCSAALIHQVRAAGSLEGRSVTDSSRTPFRLACRTRTIWQYWPVPSLSGLLSTLTLVSGIRLPSASLARCDEPEPVSFHHRRVQERLVALQIGHPEKVGFSSDELTLNQVARALAFGVPVSWCAVAFAGARHGDGLRIVAET